MSVFKSDEPLEKRVLELEKMLGKKPKKEGVTPEIEEEEEFCNIS